MKFVSFAFVFFASACFAVDNGSPYAGQERRQVKALSKTEIEGYLGGKGMGYAKAAELNNYPGPKHVLELAKELQLTEHQLSETTMLFESMQEQAVELGRLLVQKERELDQAFATNAVTSESLKSLLTEIAEVEGKLRYIHLKAHLKQRNLLSTSQVAKYTLTRGYNHHDGKH